MELVKECIEMKIVCRDCENVEFIGRDDYPYCYERFRLHGEIRKVDINTIPDWCPLEDHKEKQ